MQPRSPEPGAGTNLPWGLGVGHGGSPDCSMPSSPSIPHTSGTPWGLLVPSALLLWNVNHMASLVEVMAAFLPLTGDRRPPTSEHNYHGGLKGLHQLTPPELRYLPPRQKLRARTINSISQMHHGPGEAHCSSFRSDH